jgi:hypothetical protein
VKGGGGEVVGLAFDLSVDLRGHVEGALDQTGPSLGVSSSAHVQANAKANQAGQNQVDGHEVAQQPWNDQDEDSSHDRNDGMQVSDADVHGAILLAFV